MRFFQKSLFDNSSYFLLAHVDIGYAVMHVYSVHALFGFRFLFLAVVSILKFPLRCIHQFYLLYFVREIFRILSAWLGDNTRPRPRARPSPYFAELKIEMRFELAELKDDILENNFGH